MQQNNEDENDESIDEYDPYMFIKSLPPVTNFYRPFCNIPNKKPGLPNITLVLDLDETLVHASTEPLAKADDVFSVVCNDIT